MKDMQIVIKGNNIKLTPALKDYVHEKIGRLSKFFEAVRAVEVELTHQDNKSADQSQKLEVTLNANGTIFRCEESTVNMYASIDIVAEKLERQLQRYKQRLYQRSRVARGGKGESIEKIMEEPAPPEPRIVKMKRFAIKPMPPAEASLQMEMLNHNFYVFLNSDTEQVNVIYKRCDGDYGLIEPELE